MDRSAQKPAPRRNRRLARLAARPAEINSVEQTGLNPAVTGAVNVEQQDRIEFDDVGVGVRLLRRMRPERQALVEIIPVLAPSVVIDIEKLPAEFLWSQSFE